MAPPSPGKTQKTPTALLMLAGMVGLVVVAVAYYFTLYGDISNAITTSKQNYDKLKGDEAVALAAHKAYLDDLTKLEEQKARAKDRNKILPDTSEIASFLANINQQAEVAGLKVKTVQPMDEQLQPYYARVPVKLELTGRFHQIAKFMAGVGRLDRIINVENIDLSNPKAGDNDETTLTAHCLTTTFHAKAAAPPAASGAPGQPPPNPPPPGAPK